MELQERRFEIQYNPLFCPGFNEALDRAAEEEYKRLIITNLHELTTLVCSVYDLNVETLKLPSRKRELVYPRQVIFYIAFNYLKLTLDHIGRYFGARDHSTIIYGRDQVIEAIEEPKRNKLLISYYLNIFKRCIFEDINYRIVEYYTGTKWVEYYYKNYSNVQVAEQFTSLDGRFTIIEGEIHENGVIIKKGVFKCKKVR